MFKRAAEKHRQYKSKISHRSSHNIEIYFRGIGPGYWIWGHSVGSYIYHIVLLTILKFILGVLDLGIGPGDTVSEAIYVNGTTP